MKTAAGELRALLRGPVLADEPLSRHTTWRVGGPADLFVRPEDEQELATLLRWLGQRNLPWLAIGTGSNLLVRDGGFRGAVIHLGRLCRMELCGDGTARAGAGLPLMRLIRAAARQGWGGLEGLAGIPATLGGAVVMNAGAGGQDMAGVVSGALLVGPHGSERWDAARLALSYRRSAVPRDRVVAAAWLRFCPGATKALEEALRQRLAERRRAQGVGRPNAGSVFKNPPAGSAWRLIDRVGLRGRSIGGAQVSDKHSNFIVNCGGARAADVLALMEEIQHRVQAATGILLEPEVRVIGEV